MNFSRRPANKNKYFSLNWRKIYGLQCKISEIRFFLTNTPIIRPHCSQLISVLLAVAEAVHQGGSIRTTVRLLLIVASITCTPFSGRIWTRYISYSLKQRQCAVLWPIFIVRVAICQPASLILSAAAQVSNGEKQISLVLVLSPSKNCAKLRVICFQDQDMKCLHSERFKVLCNTNILQVAWKMREARAYVKNSQITWVGRNKIKCVIWWHKWNWQWQI